MEAATLSSAASGILLAFRADAIGRSTAHNSTCMAFSFGDLQTANLGDLSHVLCYGERLSGESGKESASNREGRTYARYTNFAGTRKREARCLRSKGVEK